jgi:crotonobetainyl-CoA:carnitine CoA-transferase CaiB-like acyl-CoA transferase
MTLEIDVDSPRALDGIRVVDLTTVLMGPLAARMLADHGADVIRIESPNGEPFLSSPPRRSKGMNWFSLNLHRNKRSVRLDLKSESGRRAMLEIVRSADVMVTNMRRSALERLGIDRASLAELNPSLIYCVANGFDSSGPYGSRPAYDDIIQSSSGLTNLEERTHGQPRVMSSVVADKVTGLHVLQAILAALFFRERTGKGQHIEVPMFETMVAFNLMEHHSGHIYEPPEGDVGYNRSLSPTRGPVQAKDGWVALMPYTDANWKAFFAAAGRPDLADDPRYSTHAERIQNSDEIYALVAELAGALTVDEWLEYCEEHSIPAGPVLDLAHVNEDPQIAAVGLVRVGEHPSEGDYRVVRDSVKYSEMSSQLYRHAPLPGEHTSQVMASLGWTDDQIAELEV